MTDMDNVFGFVSGFTDAISESGALEQNFNTTRIAIALPVELTIDAAGPELRLAVAPPRQRTETSIMPVLHRLRLTIVADGDANG
jgi:hypothetical protein